MLVEDDSFIRLTIANALTTSGFLVLASVPSAKEALEIYPKLNPELVILDLDLGVGPNGIDLAHALRAINQNLGIVFLTTFLDPRFADVRNLRPPQGSRYLVKSEVSNIAQITSVLLQTKHRPLHSNFSQMIKYGELTDTQIEVWKLVASGLTSGEIAERRGISEKGVEAIISRIYTFLDIKKTKHTNPRILLVNAFQKLSGKS
jgi:DNA-binding NarL/FixJ family response regulator